MTPLGTQDRAQVECDLSSCAVDGRSQARGLWPNNGVGWFPSGYWPVDVTMIGGLLIYASVHWLVKHEQSGRARTAACLDGRNYAVE